MVLLYYIVQKVVSLQKVNFKQLVALAVIDYVPERVVLGEAFCHQSLQYQRNIGCITPVGEVKLSKRVLYLGADVSRLLEQAQILEALRILYSVGLVSLFLAVFNRLQEHHLFGIS